MIRFITAGESHGKGLIAILEGIPADLRLKEENINKELARRQQGYGRGERMKIEKDKVEILSGLRFGKTLGTPLTLLVENRDWENWKLVMDINQEPVNYKPVTCPRPGHADLAGILKYNFEDIRNVLERASARETAARVAVGAVCKKFLEEFNIKIFSRTLQIGSVQDKSHSHLTVKELETIEASPVRCLNKSSSKKMMLLIDQAQKRGDSLGGAFEILVTNVPPGIGSYNQWNLKLDGRLAQALMSIQAIKAVEIGMGTQVASRFGSQVHDEIFFDKRRGFFHKTNNAGGIEGGLTNGETLILKATMKPISTLRQPLQSVDLATKKATQASVERADICAVPAACVISEAVVAFVIAQTLQEKFGGDSLQEMKRNYLGYIQQVKKK